MNGGARRAPSRTLGFVLLVAWAVVAAACGGSPDALVVYSGRSEALISPLIEEFEASSGVDVEVRYGSSADLALLIAEEGDRSPADVFISQSPGATGFLAEAGMLAKLPGAVLELTEERFSSAGGFWVGISGRIRVLVYNEDLIDPATLPDSVLDLADPRFDGMVGVAPANGSFQDFVTAMRQTVGEPVTAQWLSGMADNESPTYASNSAIVEAVGRGEIPLGLVNHYYNFRALAEDPGAASVNYYFPASDVGSLIIVTAAGVTAPSDRSEDAVRLISYLLDEDAQTVLTEETFEYPLARGIAPWSGLPDLNLVDGLTYNFDRLGSELAATRRLIESNGLTGP